MNFQDKYDQSSPAHREPINNTETDTSICYPACPLAVRLPFLFLFDLIFFSFDTQTNAARTNTVHAQEAELRQEKRRRNTLGGLRSTVPTSVHLYPSTHRRRVGQLLSLLNKSQASGAKQARPALRCASRIQHCCSVKRRHALAQSPCGQHQCTNAKHPTTLPTMAFFASQAPGALVYLCHSEVEVCSTGGPADLLQIRTANNGPPPCFVDRFLVRWTASHSFGLQKYGYPRLDVSLSRCSLTRRARCARLKCQLPSRPADPIDSWTSLTNWDRARFRSQPIRRHAWRR